MKEFILWGSNFIYEGFLYDLFFMLGFVAVFFFYLWRGPRFGISPAKSVLLVVVVYPTVVLLIMVMYWIESGFTGFGGNNIVRGFVYMPLIALPAGKLMGIEWKKACDLLAPATCVVHSVAHWGCVFGGCCRGFDTQWGLYNHRTQGYCFPSPPLEALTALAIVVLLLWREKKNNYRVDGLSMPIMLIIFGFTRFIWEFFRDNEKLWLGCSSLAFHALFMAVVGLIMYRVIKNKNSFSRTR